MWQLLRCFRTELCRFSGAKIYPGRGIRFIRSDSQVRFTQFSCFDVVGVCDYCVLTVFGLVSSYESKWMLWWSLKVFLFLNSKCKRYFHNKLKPSKLTWTAMYRKQHKKVTLFSWAAICFNQPLTQISLCCMMCMLFLAGTSLIWVVLTSFISFLLLVGHCSRSS